MDILLLTIQGVIFFLLVFLSMFFSGGETALTTLGKPQIKRLLEKYPKRAKFLKIWLDRPNRLLTAILIGNNFVNICASAIATSLAINFAQYLGWNKSYTVGITVGIVIFIVLVFGEIIPKTFSKQNARQVSLFFIKPIFVFSKIIAPLIKVLVVISNVFIHTFGGTKVKDVPFLTEEEIRILIDLGAQEGVLEKEEGKMIRDVLEFSETVVREVMIPRVKIHCIEADESLDKVVQYITKIGHSRVPVFSKNLDNIIGILYAKDLLKIWSDRNSKDMKLRDLLRQPYFVPESKKVPSLLKEFKKGKMHIAIVVDEYGITSGLVTLEDLVEEITGEILDEYDIEEKTIERQNNGTIIIYAEEDIDKINEDLALNLPTDKFDSLGGLIVDLFGKVPRQGEEIDYKNVKFIIESSTQKKVVKVRIKRLNVDNTKK